MRENHCKSRYLLLWIVIVFLFLISHLLTRCFFGFLFLSWRMGGACAIKEACVTLSSDQIWSFTISLDAEPCPLSQFLDVSLPRRNLLIISSSFLTQAQHVLLPPLLTMVIQQHR